MRTTASYDEIWNGNWKLSTENGLEQIHTQQLHPGTAESWSPAASSRVEPNGEVDRVMRIWQALEEAYEEVMDTEDYDHVVLAKIGLNYAHPNEE